MAKDPVRVVYCFAPQDLMSVKPLEAHLSSLKKQGIIETWSPEKIAPGQEVASKTYSSITEADIILLFLSADFLLCCENFIELISLLRQTKKIVVIPIILRSGDYSGYWFSKLKALPPNDPSSSEASASYTPILQWKNTDSAWTAVAEGIRAAVDVFDKSWELVRRKIVKEDNEEGIFDFLTEHPYFLRKMFPTSDPDEHALPLIRPNFDGIIMNAVLHMTGFERTSEICTCNVLYFLSPKRVDREILENEIEKIIEWNRILRKNMSKIKTWMRISFRPSFKYIIVSGRRSDLQKIAINRLSRPRIPIDIRSYDWMLDFFDSKLT